MKLLLFLLLPISVSAQTFRWQQTLGTGTYINSIVAIGDKILASSHYPKEAAFFVSYDDGKNWEKTDIGLPTTDLNHFTKDSGATIYAAGYTSNQGGGIYRSLDSGNSWTYLTKAPSPYAKDDPIDIEVDNLGNVFVTLRVSSNPDTAALIRSVDKGETWQRMYETSAIETRLENIAIDSKNVIYLNVQGAIGGGVLFSTDGFWWQYKLESFPDQSPRRIFTFGERLYASSSVGLYYAENHLSPFVRIPAEHESVWINAIAFVDQTTFYCGTYEHGVHRRGSDGKLREINEGLRHHDVNTIIKTDNGTILCGTSGGGIYRLEPPSSVHGTMSEHPLSLTIHSNPCHSDKLSLSCTVNKQTSMTLSLYDVAGKLLRRFEQSLAAPEEQLFELDIAGLPNGSYLCLLNTGSSRAMQNLIISH